jgi:hypothetical protein
MGRADVHTGWSGLALVLALAMAPSMPVRAAGEPPVQVASDAAPERHGAVFVDPLGFLMFGGRIGVEAGGDRVTGAIYGRWFDAGLLSRSLFLNDGESFGFSYGGGVRGRYYTSENQTGAHVGLAAEYLRTRIEDRSALVATISSYVVPYVEGGYRFARGRLFADGSLAFGYAARISGSVENLPGGNTAGLYTADNQSSIYGSASLELGVLF